MTIKQIIVGTAVGALALAFCLHRFPKEAKVIKSEPKVSTVAKPSSRKSDQHQVAFTRTRRKAIHRKGDSETQLSSRQLY